MNSLCHTKAHNNALFVRIPGKQTLNKKCFMPLLAQLNKEQYSKVPIFPRHIHPPPRQSYLATFSDLNGSPLRLMAELSLSVELWAQERGTP